MFNCLIFIPSDKFQKENETAISLNRRKPKRSAKSSKSKPKKHHTSDEIPLIISNQNIPYVNEEIIDDTENYYNLEREIIDGTDYNLENALIEISNFTDPFINANHC